MADLSSLIIDGVTYNMKDTVARQGTSDDFVGATASAAGTHGLVPAPAAGDNTKFLQGDGSWAAAGGSSSLIADEYNSSTTYEVGDYFTYNGVFYRVITRGTGITPPNTNYYTATNVASELNSNSTSVNGIPTVYYMFPHDGNCAFVLFPPEIYLLGAVSSVTVHSVVEVGCQVLSMKSWQYQTFGLQIYFDQTLRGGHLIYLYATITW